MGQISLYARLVKERPSPKQPIVVKSPEEVSQGFPIIIDAKDITLAQYDRNTKDVVTAHRVKDYRRKQYNFVMLPSFEGLHDKVLEGSEYWNALLHDESPYG